MPEISYFQHFCSTFNNQSTNTKYKIQNTKYKVQNRKNVFFVKLGNINQISFFVQNRRLQMSSISNETYLASSLSFLVKLIFIPG